MVPPPYHILMDLSNSVQIINARIREINTIKTHIFRLNRGFNEITDHVFKDLFEKILKF